MAHEDLSDLNKLWQDQPAEKVPMTVEDIRNRAGRLEQKVGWRNLREYAAAVVVLVISIALGLREKNVAVLIGGGLLMLGTLSVVYYLYRFGTVRSMPSDLGLKDCVDFHRAELVRQRDLLRSVWWWYLLPFVPGSAFILVGRAIERPDRRWPALGVAVAFVVMGMIVGKLNGRVARRLQQRIDDIDRAR